MEQQMFGCRRTYDRTMRVIERLRGVGTALATVALVGCGGMHGVSPKGRAAVPIPPPDSLPTALRERSQTDPPLDYVLVAFDDTVSAARRAAILNGIDGVVVGGVSMGSAPPSYIVRIPAARDLPAVGRLLDRLRHTPGVFAAGLWPPPVGFESAGTPQIVPEVCVRDPVPARPHTAAPSASLVAR